MSRRLRRWLGETRVRSIFQLTDAVSSRNLDPALRCLTSLLESGEEPLAIIGMLARQIRLLIRAKSLREQSATVGRMTQGFNLPPPRRRGPGRARRLAFLAALSGALHALSEADLAIKTGKAAAPAVMTGLVWNLCLA
ncbi:MAG: hypothetical protein M5R38_16910 [Candidatus Methylomirabilis sp.]|nr:hypothetical protein [Candidatus Methylomirabilis sp.]